MLRLRACLAAATAFAALFPSSGFSADAVSGAVAAAVADPARAPTDIPRDANRKPAEILAFAQVKPGQKIVDFMPGQGYYTRILSKVAGAKGKVYAYVPMADNAALQKPIGTRPVDDMLSISNVYDYANVMVLWEKAEEFGVPEQIDLVWTTDNYHDLHTKALHADVPKIDAAIFRDLKPGGVFLVVDHAAAKGTGFNAAETLHRSDEDAVKAEVTAAGFVLDGESRALANGNDDHTKPVFAMHDKTDQFALRFKKPANAASGDDRPKTDPLTDYYGNTMVTNAGLRGKVTGQRERRIFYHKDGTYQEFGPPNTGNNPLQEGIAFWDATGKSCMLHQFPLYQRGFTVCNELPAKHVGDKWVSATDRGIPYTLVKGLQYYPAAEYEAAAQ
jgi:predicted methyltransferase